MSQISATAFAPCANWQRSGSARWGWGESEVEKEKRVENDDRDVVMGLLAIAMGHWQCLPNPYYGYRFDLDYEIQTCTYTCTNLWPQFTQVCKFITIPNINFLLDTVIAIYLFNIFEVFQLICYYRSQLIISSVSWPVVTCHFCTSRLLLPWNKSTILPVLLNRFAKLWKIRFG